MVDSTDRERLSITKEELYKMLNCEDLKKAAVLIFANKQDIKGAMSSAEISQQLNLTSIKDHGWHIQACCALTGEGFVHIPSNQRHSALSALWIRVVRSVRRLMCTSSVSWLYRIFEPNCNTLSSCVLN